VADLAAELAGQSAAQGRALHPKTATNSTLDRYGGANANFVRVSVPQGWDIKGEALG